MKYSQHVLAAILILLMSGISFAQNAPAGSAASFYLGPLLPKNIGASDEILNVWGFRYALDRGNGKFLETGYMMSNSEFSEFRNIDISLRVDIPLQDLTSFFVIGPDLVSYQSTYYMGVHVGGGILAHIADTTFFRSEMRFNFHPGTALLFFFGFDFHF